MNIFLAQYRVKRFLKCLSKLLDGNKPHALAFSDMKHEPGKFWAGETIVFNLCKIIPIHD